MVTCFPLVSPVSKSVLRCYKNSTFHSSFCWLLLSSSLFWLLKIFFFLKWPGLISDTKTITTEWTAHDGGSSGKVNTPQFVKNTRKRWQIVTESWVTGSKRQQTLFNLTLGAINTAQSFRSSRQNVQGGDMSSRVYCMTAQQKLNVVIWSKPRRRAEGGACERCGRTANRNFIHVI